MFCDGSYCLSYCGSSASWAISTRTEVPHVTVLLLSLLYLPSPGVQTMENLETNTPEDIQRQQADLQAKILSLLGSSAVVPSSSPSTSAASLKPTLPHGNYSSSGSAAAISYPHQSQQNSGSYSGYAGGGVSGSMEGNSGYGAYGYSYR